MLDQKFYTCTRNEQLKFIIDLNCLGDKRFKEHKDFYERTHNSSFEFDNIRYDYNFLKHLNLYEAVKLYDCLKESIKDILIKIIELDHSHLNELVAIHNTVTLFNTDVQNCIAS